MTAKGSWFGADLHLDGRDDQTAWAAGSRGDDELDPAKSGIGDGLAEQLGSQDWQQGALA